MADVFVIVKTIGNTPPLCGSAGGGLVINAEAARAAADQITTGAR